MSDVEADLLIELRKLARAEEKSSTFDLEIDGARFEVGYVGGSSSRLTLRAPYDRVAQARVSPVGGEASYRANANRGRLAGIRPMSIKLRPETNSDRNAKGEGVSREHQTGDDLFDYAVYVDSPTTDTRLLDAVLCETVRAGAMELLSLGFEWIDIDDQRGDVTAMMIGFGKLKDVADRAPRVAKAFAAVVNGLPPVSASPGAHPTRGIFPFVAAIAGGIATVTLAPIGFFAIADAHRCMEPAGDGESLKSVCNGGAAIALVFAMVVATIVTLLTRRLARATLSGHSDSHKRILRVTIATFVWCAIAAFLLAASATLPTVN